MNQQGLEDWAHRTMQALQEFCDDAQMDAGDPDGESELQDIRALMNEYEHIVRGQPLWLAQIATLEASHDIKSK